MNEMNDWQVFAYALDDPALDRAAFEDRMQSDVDLALAVADAVRDIELVRAAAHASPPVCFALEARSESNFKASGWHWSSVAVLAAVLLIAVGLGLRKFDSLNESPIAASAPTGIEGPAEFNGQPLVSEHFVVERWLAMRGEASTSDLIDGGDTVLSSDDAREFLPVATDSESEEDDWMLKAAREFYTQGATS